MNQNDSNLIPMNLKNELYTMLCVMCEALHHNGLAKISSLSNELIN